MAIRKIYLVCKLPNAGSTTRNNREENALIQALNANTSSFARDDIIKNYYTTEVDAIRACEQLATTNPLTPYAVFTISTIRETGTPQVVEKKFTDEGELVIV